MARQTWTNRLTYILTVAGATVGFGATWRFPYLVGQNGGGAYVLVFILVMLSVGIPIILVENVIGRHAKKNSVDAYSFIVGNAKTHPFWKIFGYTGILGAFGILAYYMVIGGWVISYISHIFMGSLGINGGLDLSEPISREITESFFNKAILSSPYEIGFATFFFVFCNYLILRKGIISGIERAVKYLMPLLFICLILMVIRNLTLDGALEGVKFYLTPNFSKIVTFDDGIKFNTKLFLDVLGQVFFALSLGFGVMITLSSHLSSKEHLGKTALITGIINTLIAVLAGFMIFPSLFSAGLDPESGPSLVFKALPIAFAHMHFGNFFAIIFFTLLIIAALTTSLTIYQVIIAVLYEKFKLKYEWAINITLITIFIFGNIPCILSMGPWSSVQILGMNIFDTFDKLSGNIFFVITALGAAIFVGYVMRKIAILEMNNNNQEKFTLFSLIWFNYIRYVAPIIILIIFVYGVKEAFF